MRAIHLYCDLVAGAVLDGLQAELAASGVDIGARPDIAGQAFAAEPAAEFPEESGSERGDGELGDEAASAAVH
jgi:small subunit ribosomal protein S2